MFRNTYKFSRGQSGHMTLLNFSFRKERMGISHLDGRGFGFPPGLRWRGGSLGTCSGGGVTRVFRVKSCSSTLCGRRGTVIFCCKITRPRQERQPLTAKLRQRAGTAWPSQPVDIVGSSVLIEGLETLSGSGRPPPHSQG